MSCTIEVSKPFKREFKRLMKKYRSIDKDLMKLCEEIRKNPFIGTDLGCGVRKVRMAVSAKSKGEKPRSENHNIHGDTKCRRPVCYLIDNIRQSRPRVDFLKRNRRAAKRSRPVGGPAIQKNQQAVFFAIALALYYLCISKSMKI